MTLSSSHLHSWSSHLKLCSPIVIKFYILHKKKPTRTLSNTRRTTLLYPRITRKFFYQQTFGKYTPDAYFSSDLKKIPRIQEHFPKKILTQVLSNTQRTTLSYPRITSKFFCQQTFGKFTPDSYFPSDLKKIPKIQEYFPEKNSTSSYRK